MPHPLTWLASSFGHPGRKPVNWTRTTKEGEVVEALEGEAVGLGLVQPREGMVLWGQQQALEPVGGD